VSRRLADRVVRSDPARGPLQLHFIDRKTEIVCVRCGNRTQTSVLAVVDGDWRKLVDRACYDAWTAQLGLESP
jgi:hypothetical protein